MSWERLGRFLSSASSETFTALTSPGETIFKNLETISVMVVFKRVMKTHIPQTNPTNKLLLTAVAALALAMPSTSLLAQDQGATNSDTNSQTGPNHPPDGPPLLPPRAVEALNLTDAQKQQLKFIQEQVKTQIEAILTPAQLDQLKQMRAQHRHGWGPKGHGGPGGGTPPAPPSTNQPAS